MLGVLLRVVRRLLLVRVVVRGLLRVGLWGVWAGLLLMRLLVRPGLLLLVRLLGVRVLLLMGARLLLVRLLIGPGLLCLLLDVRVLLLMGLLRNLLVRLLLGVLLRLLVLLRVLLVGRGLLRGLLGVRVRLLLLVVRARLLLVGLLVRAGLLVLLVRRGLLRGLLVGLLLLLLGVLRLLVVQLLLVLRVLLGLGGGVVGLAVGVESEVPDPYPLSVDGLGADLAGLRVDPDHLAVVIDGVEGVGRAVRPRHDDDGSGAGPGVVQVLGDAGVALGGVPGVAQGRVGPAVDVLDSAALARTPVEAAVGVGVPGARGGHLRIAEPGLQEGTAAVDAVVGAAGDDESAVVLELRPGLEGVRMTDRGAVGVAWHRVGQ